MPAPLRLSDPLNVQDFEKRTKPRMVIALPILITLGRTRYNALLRNISNAGAMIQSSAPLSVDSKIEFHCGSIVSDTTVIWCRGSHFGLRFDCPISDQQLREQISRAEAVANWRGGRTDMRGNMLVARRVSATTGESRAPD